MSELDTFVQLIKNILGNENQLRKESETILNQVRERNPNQYFLGLLELLKGKYPGLLFRYFFFFLLTSFNFELLCFSN